MKVNRANPYENCFNSTATLFTHDVNDIHVNMNLMWKKHLLTFPD